MHADESTLRDFEARMDPKDREQVELIEVRGVSPNI